MATRRAPLLLVAVAFAVIGCGSGASAGTDAEPVATTTVELPPSYRFAPEAIRVDVGATVTWINRDNFTHNVALAGDAAEPLQMAPGEQVTHTFDAPGTYDYVCSLHPNDMRGRVVVGGG